MAERRPRASEQDRQDDGRPSGRRRQDGSEDGHATVRRGSRRPSPVELARRAAGELSELIGREPEGVVSLERTEGGWCVGVEVVELRRVPDSADILAEYAVDVDERGALVGYHRTGRYTRGRTQDES